MRHLVTTCVKRLHERWDQYPRTALRAVGEGTITTGVYGPPLLKSAAIFIFRIIINLPSSLACFLIVTITPNHFAILFYCYMKLLPRISTNLTMIAVSLSVRILSCVWWKILLEITCLKKYLMTVCHHLFKVYKIMVVVSIQRILCCKQDNRSKYKYTEFD